MELGKNGFLAKKTEHSTAELGFKCGWTAHSNLLKQKIERILWQKYIHEAVLVEVSDMNAVGELAFVVGKS